MPIGPNGNRLCSNYAQRNDDAYKNELGRSILEVIKVVPDGVLVFFPSYSLMENCLGFWKKSLNNQKQSLYDQICQVKAIIIEPKEKGELGIIMEKYYRHLNDGSKKGAIFFAVCRGKVSEGLDFSDSKARAVIITGIPYPPVKDPKVVLKQQYLNDIIAEDKSSNSKPTTLLTGAEWYNQQASRAVNQAIGRVIRHRNDYGAILLFDERFGAPKTINQLSKWLRPHVKVRNSFNEMKLLLDEFFNRHAKLDSTRFTKSDELFLSTTPANIGNIFEKVKETIDETRNFFSGTLDANNLILSEAPPLTQLSNTSSTSFMKVFSEITLQPNAKLEDGNSTRDKAKNFLDTLMNRLKPLNMKKFNSTLKQYRTSGIKVEELINTVFEIFIDDNAQDLIPEFGNFISSKHQSLYSQMVEELKIKLQIKIGPQNPIVPTKRNLDTFGNAPSGSSGLASPADLNKSTPICLICKDPVRNGYSAKCHHICCFSCWSSWLQIKLECPMCKMRTRIPQLKKAFL